MFEGQMDLDEDGYIKTTGNVLTTFGARRFPECLRAATCRTGATGRRLRPRDRDAWLRLRRRSIWKSAGTEKQGSVVSGQDKRVVGLVLFLIEGATSGFFIPRSPTARDRGHP